MTTYRAGQRVRIEWPDGSAAEGTVEWSNANGWAMPLGDIYVGLDALAAKPTSITVLSEPRPEEPTGLGAVVDASIAGSDKRIYWVRHLAQPETGYAAGGIWICDQPIGTFRWDDLIDPVVLSEGWTP